MRPKQILTSKETHMITALIKMGKTDTEIAECVGIPRTTYLDVIKYNNLVGTVKQFKNFADTEMELSLYSIGVKGNLGAIQTWLYNRKPKDWKSTNYIEQKIIEVPKIEFIEIKNNNETKSKKTNRK